MDDEAADDGTLGGAVGEAVGAEGVVGRAEGEPFYKKTVEEA